MQARPEARRPTIINNSTRDGTPMNRTSPPFRAEHIGSLLRPPELLAARREHAAGRVSDDALKTIEQNAIRRVVKQQEAAGLQLVTDGEFRRSTYSDSPRLPASPARRWS
jgi:hypothetical protein